MKMILKTTPLISKKKKPKANKIQYPKPISSTVQVKVKVLKKGKKNSVSDKNASAN